LQKKCSFETFEQAQIAHFSRLFAENNVKISASRGLTVAKPAA
jgi:hypothetical protein